MKVVFFSAPPPLFILNFCYIILKISALAFGVHVHVHVQREHDVFLPPFPPFFEDGIYGHDHVITHVMHPYPSISISILLQTPKSKI